MEKSADVVIVGAGIAGQALAYLLQKNGVSTLLLDRRRSQESIPRGITFQPNGLEALEKIGVLDQVLDLGVKNRVLEVKSWSGELLLEADYELLDHPHNYLVTVNATEVESAISYLANNAGAETLWGAGFKQILGDEKDVAAGVECTVDGDPVTVRASVVVGADGSQSRVRAAIGAKTIVRKYPEAFLVGMVGRVLGLEGRARQYQAPGRMLGIMPATRESTYMFYCVGTRSFEQVKAAGLDSFKAEIMEVAPELQDAFAGVEVWTGMGYFTPSYVRVDPWVSDGVVLLGDAAHTFHPHAGQGVNLSLQDVLVLSEVIVEAMGSKNVSAKNLGVYQAKRKMYADVIGQYAHYTASWALSENWLIRRLNVHALRKLQKNRELLREALTITAGLFTKKPSRIRQLRIAGLLP